MVTIRQHGEGHTLFDIVNFFADIDRFLRLDAWDINVYDCLGDGAMEIEERSACGLVLTDPAFRNLYRGIYQTIDGRFAGWSDGQMAIELKAVDSTFWEVSGPPDFEAHMLATYGAWQRG